MSNNVVLIVEDDENIMQVLSYNLARDGFKVLMAANGEEGLRKAKSENPSAILLDLMLPGMDGLDVCRSLKGSNATINIPIIMVTAKGEEADIVSGLEIGADDYIVKPFSPRVLSARLHAVMRRRSREKTDEISLLSIHGITIDPGRHEVLVNNMPIELTNMEFRVLHFLASRPGWVFTRYQIVEGVRGESYPVTDRSVDVLIVSLRKKMGLSGSYIETIRGVGYRFME